MKTTGEQTKRKKTEKELSGGGVLRNIQRVTESRMCVFGERRDESSSRRWTGPWRQWNKRSTAGSKWKVVNAADQQR